MGHEHRLTRDAWPLLACCLFGSASAAEPREDGLSLERIMAHPDWIGAAPERARWSADGASILFERKMVRCDEREVIVLSLSDGAEHVVPDSQRSALQPWSGTRSADGSLHAFVRDGDIHVQDLRTGATRQLTRSNADETGPMFVGGAASVAYRRGDAWFTCALDSGLESLAADLRLEADPRNDPESSFLKAQQERLFDAIREGRTRDDAAAQRARERRAADPSLPPSPFYLGKDLKLRDTSLSPSGRWLLVSLGGKDDDDWDKGLLAAHVTASGNTETRPVRPKVGSGAFESYRLVLLDLADHSQHEISLDVLPGLKAEPPRATWISHMEWSESGSRVAVQLRAADNKDRWIAEVDLESKKLVPVHRLHDPAWIDWHFNDMGWLPGRDALWFLSEESGWSQLYVREPREPRERKERRARQLTFGRQCVSSPAPTRDGRWIYFVANPGNPGVHEVHRVDVATARSERVTQLGGVNSFALSPDESQLLITHSEALRPPELYLVDSAPGSHPRQLTRSTSAAFDAISWTAPRFVDIPSTHGAGAIHARVYAPSGPPPPGGRSAVIFIHGAGNLQDAHEGWSGYFREHMFASLLAREGHVVINPDYRASAGYGRAWRTAIHQNMGGPELEDLSDCIDWLATEHAVDRQRVGAWGGSYGGFLVLMAMFKQPEMLACGAALRPVTDWAHYNHPYTSNILETPAIAPDAYRRSSPIEWAAGLSRPLLICAPMLDDNVLFQDTVRLVQRLIELEKPTFEVALYPVEPHTFVRPSSWLDEYRRIHALMSRHLVP